MAHWTLLHPPSFKQSAVGFGSSLLQPMNFPFKSFPGSSTGRTLRQKCVAQYALPEFAEALYHGLGAGPEVGISKLHNIVLQKAIALGLPFASEEASTWWAVAAPVVLFYAFAAPGTAAGLVDFLYAPVHAQYFRCFSADEVEIGRMLGEGSFGVVYEGFYGRGRKGAKSDAQHVVLKKSKIRVKGASEIHDSEIHMNYRLQRTASIACAEFLGTMQVKSSQARGKLSEGVWLVWNFQGDRSLDYYLKQKNFPENICAMVLGEDQQASTKEEVFRRNATVIRRVFKQILNNLQDLHRSGVVHRDVKPLNLILAHDTGEFKFIDFGACVDLRSGYNYVPNETVIDPTYAAPERYIMPTSTPQLPPDPLCSLISPFFWHLNTPDRFDLYSAGLILMQLCIKPLRYDSGLQSFNTEFKRSGYDLNAWRSNCRFGKEEFVYLDADGGAGWELATALLQPRYDKNFFIWPSFGRSRPSASAAIRHQFFKEPFVFPKFSPERLPDPIFPGDLMTASLQVLPSLGAVTENMSSAVHSTVSTGYEKLFRSKQDQVNDKKGEAVASSSSTVPPPVLPLPMAVSDKLGGVLHNVISKGRRENLSVKDKVRGMYEAVPVVQSSMSPSTQTLAGKFGNAVNSVLNISRHKVVEKKADMAKENLLGRKKDVLADTSKDVVTSEFEPSLKRQEKTQKRDSNNWIGAALTAVLPTAASSAFALATGWMILLGLNSSTHASYEIGKLLMSSSGISGSAFLTFFLVIKPWLEEQEITSRKAKAYKDLATLESPEKSQMEKYKSAHSEHVKAGLVETMQVLEMQMSSLEALMIKEQQVSQQQQDLVQKMESLLLANSLGSCQQEAVSPLQAGSSSTSGS